MCWNVCLPVYLCVSACVCVSVCLFRWTRGASDWQLPVAQPLDLHSISRTSLGMTRNATQRVTSPSIPSRVSRYLNRGYVAFRSRRSMCWSYVAEHTVCIVHVALGWYEIMRSPNFQMILQRNWSFSSEP